MAKEIRVHEDARSSLLAGVDGLANAVRATLGSIHDLLDRERLDPVAARDEDTVG